MTEFEGNGTTSLSRNEAVCKFMLQAFLVERDAHMSRKFQSRNVRGDTAVTSFHVAILWRACVVAEKKKTGGI